MQTLGDNLHSSLEYARYDMRYSLTYGLTQIWCITQRIPHCYFAILGSETKYTRSIPLAGLNLHTQLLISNVVRIAQVFNLFAEGHRVIEHEIIWVRT